MAYTRSQLLNAFREDYPQLRNIDDNRLFAAIAQDSPDLARGIDELKGGDPTGRAATAADYSLDPSSKMGPAGSFMFGNMTQLPKRAVDLGVATLAGFANMLPGRSTPRPDAAPTISLTPEQEQMGTVGAVAGLGYGGAKLAGALANRMNIPSHLMSAGARVRSSVADINPTVPSTKTGALVHALKVALRPASRATARTMEDTAQMMASGRPPVFPNVAAPTPSQPIDFPNAPAPQLRGPQLEYRAPAGPRMDIDFPNAPAVQGAKPVSLRTAPEINRWMNVQPKQMVHGANPAQQILDDGLLGATKEATLSNVETAWKATGKEMGAMLEAAGKRGVKMDAADIVEDAIANASKTIGKRTDPVFQGSLKNIKADILEKHPNLIQMDPTDIHALKVDIGDAVTWGKGTPFETDLNQVLVEMYRGLNKRIKDSVEGIGPLQSRWGNLYQANKSLKMSLLKDAVGRGTGATPKPLRPKLTMAEQLAEQLAKSKGPN